MPDTHHVLAFRCSSLLQSESAISGVGLYVFSADRWENNDDWISQIESTETETLKKSNRTMENRLTSISFVGKKKKLQLTCQISKHVDIGDSPESRRVYACFTKCYTMLQSDLLTIFWSKTTPNWVAWKICLWHCGDSASCVWLNLDHESAPHFLVPNFEAQQYILKSTSS